MVNPVANIPALPAQPVVASVKPATPEIMIIKDEMIPVEIMTDLIFEDIGGQEIINIARHDIINGQDVIYQPIRNLTAISLANNSQNIISMPDTSDAFFKNFSIKLENKIPNVGSGPSGETVYIDPTSRSLIIEGVNLGRDEQIEVQILSSGAVLDDTIYEG